MRMVSLLPAATDIVHRRARMGADLLPRRVTGKAEIAMLVIYGIVVATPSAS
ncbi:hypothetical protein [Actinomadura sp. KC06]|uniref:hypothetical protein n=1 Tax=Actinomadura sp. KC06 TaxID=2530369 RepID=UPI001A9F2330|nr:hypothetical protein [Actinomadura sp. KC06]